MFKKLIIFVVVALVGGLLLVVLNNMFFGGGVELAVAPTTEESGEAGPSAAVPVNGSDSEMVPASEKVVVYSASSFSPSEIRIKAGDTVSFRNENSLPFWPGSALHPTHAVYDGTTFDAHCAEGATPSFDACREIEPGGGWSFVFNKVGSWKYHDHLNASRTGTIVVE